MASESDIIKASILGLISLVGVVGNTIVSYVLIKRRKILLKNRATYQFILNLTLLDLIIGVLLCPFEFARELLGSWIFGTTLCKIVEFVEVSTSGTVVITQALIAVDRYRNLAHPHLPKLKAKYVRQMIVLSWVVPAIVSTPFLYMLNVVDVNSQEICTPLAIPVPWLDKVYEAVEFVVLFFSPFCVICCCYYHVILLAYGSTEGGRDTNSRNFPSTIPKACDENSVRDRWCFYNLLDSDICVEHLANCLRNGQCTSWSSVV